MWDKINIRKLEVAWKEKIKRREALWNIVDHVKFYILCSLFWSASIEVVKHGYRKYKLERLPEDTDANKLLRDFYNDHKSHIDVGRWLITEGAKTAFVMIAQVHGNFLNDGGMGQKWLLCQREIYDFLRKYLQGHPEIKIYEEWLTVNNIAEIREGQIQLDEAKKLARLNASIDWRKRPEFADVGEHAGFKILAEFPETILPIDDESLLESQEVNYRKTPFWLLLLKYISWQPVMDDWARDTHFVQTIGRDQRTLSLFILWNAHNLETEVEKWNTEHPEEKISFLVYTPDSLK